MAAPASTRPWDGRADFHTVIIGSGIAGLFIALEARKRGPVLIVTKGELRDSNTRWAQGGIAAAVGAHDSVEAHLRDTIEAGAGLVDTDAARVLCEDAPARIRDLVLNGVEFDTHEGELSLGLEAAHSEPRILHSGGDRTGAAIEFALATNVESSVDVAEHCSVTRIHTSGGRVRGAQIFDHRADRRYEIETENLVLATGGAGQLYAYTTNPEVATGDGVGLAYQAGAEVTDLEFYQFHPTALRVAGSRPFLISEAVRGEGAILRNASGEAFMRRYDPDQADLAPRDVVARSIAREMTADGANHVYLDCTHLTELDLAKRFPGIYAYCLGVGIDMATQPIPIAPAAHYFMGGVRTDLWGRTTVTGLYAAGEVACTGVHGANRLASNSLMETVVFGKRVAEHIAAGEGGRAVPHPDVTDPGVRAVTVPSRPELQRLMWNDAGIERSGEGLSAARATMGAWPAARPPVTLADAENEQMSVLAQLLLEAAIRRTESRGAHFRRDYPLRDDAHWLRRQVFRRDD